MGKLLAEAFAPARDVFAEVDDALSQKLSRLMWDGPESDLLLTENAQPAIMAASIAVDARARPRSCEMCAARRRSFARRVQRAVRGGRVHGCRNRTAPQNSRSGDARRGAGRRGRDGAALIGAEIDLAEAASAEAEREIGGLCVVANDNAPGQVVLSGTKATVERGCEIARAKGAKRAILLAVSAPFHCALMEPAAEAMRERLGTVAIRPLAVPVLANVTAELTSEPGAIRDLLVKQVTGRVRWRESMLKLRSLGAWMLPRSRRAAIRCSRACSGAPTRNCRP